MGEWPILHERGILEMLLRQDQSMDLRQARGSGEGIPRKVNGLSKGREGWHSLMSLRTYRSFEGARVWVHDW